MGATPLPAESKSSSKSAEAFVAANARKLGALLVLFLLGCLGLGTKVWLGFEEASVDVSKVVSGHQLLFDDGRPEHRVVGFDNIIMWRGRLHYIYADARPDIPPVLVNWHHDYFLEVTMLHSSEVPEEMKLTKVEVIKAASLTWRQWHQNYYHGLGESVYEAFNSACKYLYYCGGSNSSDVSPIFIERSGDEARWADVLPAAESALKCLMPGNNYFIGDSSLQNRVFLLKRSAAGIGPYNRKWRGYPEKATDFKRAYGPVDRGVSLKYKHILTECYGLKYQTYSPDGPFEVTIMNRQYGKGRHMVNSEEIAGKIHRLPQVKSTRVVYMEPLKFQEQIEIYATSQVLLMTHGAALVNILFMPEMLQGSVVVLYNWLQRETLSPHTWVTDYMNDLYLPVNFVGLSTKDRRYIYPMKERYVFQPEYERLPADDKANLLEKGICPPGGLPGCSDMVLNFAVDWDLLHPALNIAFTDMHQKHSHILDGVFSE